jgi:hypothetical protein
MRQSPQQKEEGRKSLQVRQLGHLDGSTIQQGSTRKQKHLQFLRTNMSLAQLSSYYILHYNYYITFEGIKF